MFFVTKTPQQVITDINKIEQSEDLLGLDNCNCIKISGTLIDSPTYSGKQKAKEAQKINQIFAMTKQNSTF